MIKYKITELVHMIYNVMEQQKNVHNLRNKITEDGRRSKKSSRVLAIAFQNFSGTTIPLLSNLTKRQLCKNEKVTSIIRYSVEFIFPSRLPLISDKVSCSAAQSQPALGKKNRLSGGINTQSYIR